MLDPSLLALLFGSAVAAQSPAVAAERFQRWEERLRTRVERLHVVPAHLQNVEPCDVTVRFSLDERGRASDAEVRQSSCGRVFERKALRLVRDLDRIGVVPSAGGHPQRVTLKLSYGVALGPEADARLDEKLAVERRTYAARNMALVAGSGAVPAASGWTSGER